MDDVRAEALARLSAPAGGSMWDFVSITEQLQHVIDALRNREGRVPVEPERLAEELGMVRGSPWCVRSHGLADFCCVCSRFWKRLSC